MFFKSKWCIRQCPQIHHLICNVVSPLMRVSPACVFNVDSTPKYIFFLLFPLFWFDGPSHEQATDQISQTCTWLGLLWEWMAWICMVRLKMSLLLFPFFFFLSHAGFLCFCYGFAIEWDGRWLWWLFHVDFSMQIKCPFESNVQRSLKVSWYTLSSW